MGVIKFFASRRAALLFLVVLLYLALLTVAGFSSSIAWLLAGIVLALGLIVYSFRRKRKWSPGVVFHLGIALIIIGGVVSWATRKFTYIEMVVNDERVVRTEWFPPLDFTLHGIKTSYWKNGDLSKVSSEVSLHSSKKNILNAIIAPNHPLSYNRVKIFLAQRGTAATFSLYDLSGIRLGRLHLLFDGNEAPQYKITRFPGTVLEIGAALPAKKNSESVRVGISSAGQTLAVADCQPGDRVDFSAGALVFEGLTVWGGFSFVKDHGKIFVWAGFFLSNLGLLWMLFRKEKKYLVAPFFRVKSFINHVRCKFVKRLRYEP